MTVNFYLKMKRGILFSFNCNNNIINKIINLLNNINNNFILIDHFIEKTEISNLLKYYNNNNKIINNNVILLLNICHKWEYKNKIELLLNNGKNVILNNYSYIPNNDNIDWFKLLNNNLLLPDYIFNINNNYNYLNEIINNNNIYNINNDNENEIINKCINIINNLKEIKISKNINKIKYILKKDMKLLKEEEEKKDKDKIKNRGCFIVFEGCDRSGKSSQCELLKNELLKNNYNYINICFPNRNSEIGKIINKYLIKELKLDSHTIHLLFSANRWEEKEKILNELYNNKIIIVDRYSYSGIVYTSSKNIYDMNIEWCSIPEIGLPEPDLLFFMDIDPKLLCKRNDFGKEIYETNEFQNNVYHEYKKLFNHINFNNKIININALDNINNINKIIIQKFYNNINIIKNTNILKINYY